MRATNLPRNWTKERLENLKGAKEWATGSQTKAIDALMRHGSIAAAAEALEIPPHSLRARLSEAQHRAARYGWSPAHDMKKTVPDGFHIKGVSTYYGRDKATGEVELRGQWVKTQKDQEHRVQLLLDELSGVLEPLRGLAPKELRKAPRRSAQYDKEVLSVYPWGDPHIGMFCWEEEAGENFDLKLAEEQIATAMNKLVSLAPQSETGLLINVGDFFHTDFVTNMTMKAGNILDVDTRWGKMIRIGIRIMRSAIDLLLTKHRFVRIINAQGNHDLHTSVILSQLMMAFYEGNPRVIVDESMNPFKYHRFGKCMLGVVHGDTTKPQDLPGVMAADRPEDWGRTLYRRWYCGHIHHDTVKEYPGCIVETIRTLAPRDAWHNQQGYRSGRDMKLDLWHHKYGYINRNIVGIEQIYNLNAEAA